VSPRIRIEREIELIALPGASPSRGASRRSRTTPFTIAMGMKSSQIRKLLMR
jgi:hypothetical protein